MSDYKHEIKPSVVIAMVLVELYYLVEWLLKLTQS